MGCINMDEKYTTIRISKEVRDQLKAIGRKGDSYDDVILKLIEQARVGQGGAE